MADAFQDVGPAAEAAARAAEDVLDVDRAAAPALGDLVLVRRAVLVVELAFLVVRQHLVRFVQLFELRLVAAGVGVMGARELAKGLLYLVGRRRAWNAQRLVVIRSRRHKTLHLLNLSSKPKAGSLLALPALVVCFYFSASSCGFSRLGPPEVTVTIAGLRTFVPIL